MTDRRTSQPTCLGPSSSRIAALFIAVAASSAVACGGNVFTAGNDDGGLDGGGDAIPTGHDASSDVVTESDAPTSTDATPPPDAPVTREPKYHRPTAVACTPTPAGSSTGCSMFPGGGTMSCKSDADCKSGKNGHCAFAAGGIPTCECFYDTCATDGDCGAGAVCACHDSPYATQSNACAPVGNCKVDGDCGPGGWCSPSSGGGCADSVTGYFCHAASDECIDDADCNTSGGGGTGPQQCRFDTTKKHWTCQPELACA